MQNTIHIHINEYLKLFKQRNINDKYVDKISNTLHSIIVIDNNLLNNEYVRSNNISPLLYAFWDWCNYYFNDKEMRTSILQKMRNVIIKLHDPLAYYSQAAQELEYAIIHMIAILKF